MTDDKRRFKTTIAGRNYTILAKKPEMHLKTVSELVNGKIKQIKEAIPTLDVEQQSVLVTINAISETIEKQEEIEHLKNIINKLEISNEAQQKKIENLENQKTTNSQTTIPLEPVKKNKQEKKHISPVKKKSSSSRFARPATISGVVLQRANMNDRRENKEVPPYSKKKRQSALNNKNGSQEER